jgi:hypothetical protein
MTNTDRYEYNITNLSKKEIQVRQSTIDNMVWRFSIVSTASSTLKEQIFNITNDVYVIMGVFSLRNGLLR